MGYNMSNEKTTQMHPGTTLNLQLSLFQLKEIMITGRGVVKRLELEMKKKENKSNAFYYIRCFNWLRIIEEIENTINKE